MYALGRRLGRGGNATIYEAVDHRGRTVALKVLNDLDDYQLARFDREARVTSAIRHPNVCATLGSGVLPDGRRFVVMERLAGESLRELLMREGRLEPELVVEIAAQMLAGLEAAHAAGMIHRDVKPENVFLARGDDGRLVVKIIDFGVCRRIDHRLDSRPLTLTGFVVGTPGYLSPEQAYGERTLDARADLFAVGLIMFEALTGRPAYLGRTSRELMNGVTQPIPSVLRYRTVANALAAVVARATEAHVSARFRSAAEMQHAVLEARTEMRRETPVRRRPVASDWDLPTERNVA